MALTHSFLKPLADSLIRLFIESFIPSSVHSFIRSFINSFVHSFIKPATMPPPSGSRSVGLWGVQVGMWEVVAGLGAVVHYTLLHCMALVPRSTVVFWAADWRGGGQMASVC